MSNSNLHSVVQDQCRETIKQNPKITANELVEILGCSYSSAARYLKEFKAKKEASKKAPRRKLESFSAQIYLNIRAANQQEAEELAKKKIKSLLKKDALKIHIIEE